MPGVEPAVAGGAANGRGAPRVTSRKAGNTVTPNTSSAGTSWAATVTRAPRPRRGSSQPRPRISAATARLNPSARGLASIERATPGFQAKEAAPPSPAASGTIRAKGGSGHRHERCASTGALMPVESSDIGDPLHHDEPGLRNAEGVGGTAPRRRPNGDARHVHYLHRRTRLPVGPALRPSSPPDTEEVAPKGLTICRRQSPVPRGPRRYATICPARSRSPFPPNRVERERASIRQRPPRDMRRTLSCQFRACGGLAGLSEPSAPGSPLTGVAGSSASRGHPFGYAVARRRRSSLHTRGDFWRFTHQARCCRSCLTVKGGGDRCRHAQPHATLTRVSCHPHTGESRRRRSCTA